MTPAAPAFCPDQLGWPLPEVGPKGPSAQEKRELLATLERTPIDWNLFGAHLAFDPECYVRRRLFLNASWEVLLLCWLPGHQTAIHDHGASWGATLVLTGDLTESRYRWRGQGLALEFGGDQTLGPRQVTVEAHETIHRVSNRGGAPAASLHLYSPPLTYLHAYEEATGDRRYVEPSESRFFTR